jgi:hypothetical protein
MSKICRLAVLCASMVALAGPAFAQAQPVRVGGLTCDAAPRVGLVVGSRQPLSVEGQFGVNLALGVARLTLR